MPILPKALAFALLVVDDFIGAMKLMATLFTSEHNLNYFILYFQKIIYAHGWPRGDTLGHRVSWHIRPDRPPLVRPKKCLQSDANC